MERRPGLGGENQWTCEETGRASRVVEAIWEERGKEQSLRWERLSRTWPTQQAHVCDTDGGDDGDVMGVGTNLSMCLSSTTSSNPRSPGRLKAGITSILQVRYLRV